MLGVGKQLFTGILVGGMLMNEKRLRELEVAQALKYPPTKDRIRGEYENRIRRNAPPEKIFEIFATLKKGNEIYMTHSDLFRAITPYNYAIKDDVEEEANKDSRAVEKPDDKKKENVHDHFKSTALVEFADIDKDGAIGLYEYYYFVIFMQSNNEFAKKFFEKESPNMELNKAQFKKYLDEIQKSNKMALTIPSFLPDPRKNPLKKEKFAAIEDAIINNIFKNQEKISYAKLAHLRDQIYKDMYAYEFYNFKRDALNQIDGEDFAKSIICYLDPSVVPRYLKDLKDVEFKGKVSFDEYVTFQTFLREHYSMMLEECQEKGVLSRKYLRKMFDYHSNSKPAKISDTQLDIFFKVIDKDQSSRIEIDEFAGVVINRSFYGSGDDTNNLEKPLVLLEKKAKVWLRKAERIWEILIE